MVAANRANPDSANSLHKACFTGAICSAGPLNCLHAKPRMLSMLFPVFWRSLQICKATMIRETLDRPLHCEVKAPLTVAAI